METYNQPRVRHHFYQKRGFDLELEFEMELRSEREKEVDEILNMLTGLVPDEGKELEDYRKERLRKYDVTDENSCNRGRKTV